MENVHVKIEGEQKEITFLHGKALDPKEPILLIIKGIINSVWLFLSQRITEIAQKTAHIIVNREKMTISLVYNETDPNKIGKVTGEISMSEEYLKFKINTGSQWTCFDLADFIKMNRSYFESKDIAAKLILQLRNFKAKVDKEIELSKDDKANYSAKRTQVVNANLPETFAINVKIFKGMDAINIPVEINIHPETLNCILISPDANDFIQKYVDEAINDQIEKIKSVAPEIVIIEE